MQDNNTDEQKIYHILLERLLKDFVKVKFVFVSIEHNYKNIKELKEKKKNAELKDCFYFLQH